MIPLSLSLSVSPSLSQSLPVSLCLSLSHLSGGFNDDLRTAHAAPVCGDVHTVLYVMDIDGYEHTNISTQEKGGPGEVGEKERGREIRNARVCVCVTY